MIQFQAKYGPWALVSGAGRGIGRSIALEVASRGLNLVLTDILPDDLRRTAEEARLKHRVQTLEISADLGKASDVEQLIRACSALQIGLVCSNHAATHLFPDGRLRPWLDCSHEQLQAMLQIDVASIVRLTHHFVGLMRERKQGGIVTISSGASLIGTPYLAQYAATKAFLTNLGEALWWELKRDGIDIVTVLPGLTKTPGAFRFVRKEAESKVPAMEPEEVAKVALDSLGKGPTVIPGWRNQLQAFLTMRLLPRRTSIAALGKLLPQVFNVSDRS